MAAGLGYEFGWGEEEVLQNTNEARLWLSANKGFGKLHLGGAINYIMAEDDSNGTPANTDMITVHLNADYYLTEWFSPVMGLNGYFAQGADPGISGVDAVSLGTGDGEDTITGALGFEVRPLGPELGIRAAYETELSSGDSLFGHRWTLSAVYEF